MAESGSAPEVVQLALEGDLTIYNAIEIKQRLLDAVRQPGTIDLDLSQVGEMDTAGFQVLVLAKRESQRLGHPMRIVSHSQGVRAVLEAYNMLTYFGDPLVIPAEDRR
jgi:anti-anti-sigma factor